MVPWALMFAVALVASVYGRPPLPPLPMKDGCYLVSPEVALFRVEGEAVILSFPSFRSVLRVRKIAPSTARYLINKNNGTEGVSYDGEGRVQQRNKQLWLLPAQVSDSGEYSCTYRNQSYCVTGTIRLHVYESGSLDMEKLSYPISAAVGERLSLPCPSLAHFNKTDTLIQWHKNSSSTHLQPGGAGWFQRDSEELMIPAVKPSHGGIYTCQLTATINEQQYRVSRFILLHVQGPDPAITTTVPQPSVTSVTSVTSDPELSSSSSTIPAPIIRPPVIISPRNGTVFEIQHGSGLELFCKVLADCQTADSTEVTWLANGQSVESSYLNGRALQGGRSVTRVSDGCRIELRLIVVEITEEDVKTELTCVSQNEGGRQEVVAQLQLEDSTFTWLVVGVVAVSCFLTVVSIFLCVLFKPKRKKKMDYILARHDSTF